MTVEIDASHVAGRLRPGERVYLAGATGEPSSVVAALAKSDLPPGSTFTGVWLPGINRFDPSSWRSDAVARAHFVTPELRSGFAAGRIDLCPWHYTRIDAALRVPAAVDVAIARVSPPDRNGNCTLGFAADFTPAVLASGARFIGVVDPALPATRGHAQIPVERIEALVTDAGPLPTLPDEPLDAAFAAIGEHVAGLVRDGDTIQLGLGKVQAAVLRALGGHRDLALHGGMVSTPVMALAEAGVLSRGITAGIAVGTPALYDWLRRSDRMAFVPVGTTHALSTLAAIPRFVAVNSVLEVDLFGQACADTLDGRQVSGHGGIVDFQRGALASPGGRSILALCATAAGGTRSRIVARLEGPVSCLRADADLVVTEHGVADLRDAGVEARAQRLIALAAPHHRDPLADAWDSLRRRM